LLGPDAISPLSRYAALIAQAPVIQLAPPVARELGLREGQVVQGTFSSQGEGLELTIGDKRFSLSRSPGWGADGDLRWFRFEKTPDGWGLRSLPAGAQAPVSSSGGALSGTAAPLAALPASPAPEAAALPSTRLLSLLSRPPGLSNLAHILTPGVLESTLRNAGVDDRVLLQALAISRLRVDALSAEGVRQAVMTSGLWGEALLAMGRQIPMQDLKSLLRFVARAMSARAASAGAVEEAIDDIERNQIEALQTQNENRQAFTVMLPFADVPPATVKFERGTRSGRGTPQGYTIDLHLAPGALGDIWLKTTVTGQQVDVTVWTARPEVASLAQRAGEELAVELADAGLRLGAFNVLAQARTDGTVGTGGSRVPVPQGGPQVSVASLPINRLVDVRA
jgi:hypothetical protein